MSSLSPVPPFEMTFRVEESDIDHLGHVNNIVYLRWVQEIATIHWEAEASAEDLQQLLWVVSRHEIDYKSSALLGDEVVVRTCVGTATGLTFVRHTEIRRASDRKLLAQARTLWIPINSETRRPQRPSRELRARFSVEAPEAAKPSSPN